MSDEARRRAARVFFALVPDGALQGALGALGRELAARVGGRAIVDDNIHLTLAFVGAVDAARLDALKAVLAASPGRDFAMTLDNLGTWKHAGVAWIAPSAVPAALVQLQETLAASLRIEGFAVEARPYRPHVTLARRCARSLRPTPCAPLEWRVCALSLMQSEAAARGVRYREIARRDFAC